MLPILFLHGWGTSSASFAPVLNYYTNLTQVLKLDFDCNPSQAMTLNDYCDVAEKVLLENKITKCNIVAHSFGCRVAVLLCNRNPHMIEKLVLTGAAGLKPRFSLKRFIRAKRHIPSADYKILSQTGKATFKNIIHTNLNYEIRNIQNPTLLIFGKRDKSTPLYMAKRWTKLQKSCKLIVYRDAGHCAFLDKSAQFIRDTNAFLGAKC